MTERAETRTGDHDPIGVSFLMPVHNARDTVEAAAHSLLAGTYESIELIAIDDGSTDGTGAVLDRLAVEDSRVVVLHRSHQGIVSALNAGLQACRGDLIGRMDADDWSAPARVEKQVAMLEADPSLSVVSCLVKIEPFDGRLTDGLARYQRWLNGTIGPEEIARRRFVESPVAHPTVLGRRRVFEDGYREGPFPEDYELWLRRLAVGDRFAKVPEVLLHWRDSPTRLSRTHRAYTPEAFFDIKLRYLLDGPLRDQESVVVWGGGPIGKRWLKALLASGRQVPHLVERDPRKIGQRIHGADVIHPDQLTQVRGDRVVLTAVGVAGARAEIRDVLTSYGLQEGDHFWAVC
jgi:glycosyltransferase involved in cell wall biosynthesis